MYGKFGLPLSSEKAAEEYNKGKSIATIAGEYGLTRKEVSSILNKSSKSVSLRQGDKSYIVNGQQVCAYEHCAWGNTADRICVMPTCMKEELEAVKKAKQKKKKGKANANE